MPDRASAGKRTKPDVIVAQAKILAAAWKRYVELLGEPPHGTVKQLAALLELRRGRVDPCGCKYDTQGLFEESCGEH